MQDTVDSSARYYINVRVKIKDFKKKMKFKDATFSRKFTPSSLDIL